MTQDGLFMLWQLVCVEEKEEEEQEQKQEKEVDEEGKRDGNCPTFLKPKTSLGFFFFFPLLPLLLFYFNLDS